MKITLNTYVLLWAATTPERLGDGLALLRDGERLVSVATVWEPSRRSTLPASSACR